MLDIINIAQGVLVTLGAYRKPWNLPRTIPDDGPRSWSPAAASDVVHFLAQIIENPALFTPGYTGCPEAC
jgi:hypothetical protein